MYKTTPTDNIIGQPKTKKIPRLPSSSTTGVPARFSWWWWWWMRARGPPHKIVFQSNIFLRWECQRVVDKNLTSKHKNKEDRVEKCLVMKEEKTCRRFAHYSEKRKRQGIVISKKQTVLFFLVLFFLSVKLPNGSIIHEPGWLLDCPFIKRIISPSTLIQKMRTHTHHSWHLETFVAVKQVISSSLPQLFSLSNW